MSHHPFGPSVLLPRLLVAIGAGGVLAGSGCGAKSDERSSEAINEVGGGQQTKDPTTGIAGSATHTTSGTHATSSPTTNYIESSSPATDVDPTLDQESTNETTSTSPTDGPATAADAGSTINGPQCEYGQLMEFCVAREQMENAARWGMGNPQPSEPLRSEDEIAAGFDENGCMKQEWIASGCCNPALTAGEPQQDGTCCYKACEGVCCGRPFVVNGLATVATVVERKDWLLQQSPTGPAATDVVSLSPEQGTALAEAWLADAQMEHASVASFSHFSFDLLQLGAPPELLRACHQACLDEIEHARIGFSVASLLGGKNYGPGPLVMGAIQPHTLTEALTAVIFEGCVGETLAAGIVAEQARVCTNPTLAAQLKNIAEDELRHSELAWRFVAWALGHFGAQARVAVEVAFARALTQLPAAPADLGLPLAVLHHGGRLTQAEWVHGSRRVFDEVLTPAVEVLLRDRPANGANQPTAIAVS